MKPRTGLKGISAAVQLLHTVRYLRMRQMIYRLKHAVETVLPLTRPTVDQSLRFDCAPDPAFRPGQGLPQSTVRADDIRQNRFTFLNRRVDFGEVVDWHPTSQDRLWRYNLHYFDFLLPENGLDEDAGHALMLDWIRQNPPGTPDAWDPYPLSLRLVNWIKYLSRCARARDDRPQVVRSMIHQARWLEQKIEYHLLGNHLFKNAKALVFCGRFFEGAAADRWLRRGVRILADEIREQVLEDGGHFERSPMYHAMILEDVIDLVAVLKTNMPAGTESLMTTLAHTADKMMRFLTAMTHPDGEIALFNDAAFGIEARYETLVPYYEAVLRKAPPVTDGKLIAFRDTGYYILRPDTAHFLVVDCGPVGPDYQPGHAHCDTLSFELSVGGQRVIVDSGCCRYADGDIRRYNRGNDGHNTMTIDGENQSEVWGAHRCARRAFPRLLEFEEKTDGRLSFVGIHDGYTRLPGKPVHRRQIVWQEGCFRITDSVLGAGRHRLSMQVHIHPDLKVSLAGRTATVGGDAGMLMRITMPENTDIRLSTGWYCPEFNRQSACPRIVFDTGAVELPFQTEWVLETV